MKKQTKTDKQKVVSNDFDFSNISNADKNINKEKPTPKDENHIIKFRVHKNLIERFHLIRFAYAKSNKMYNFSSNKMLSTCIEFMEQKFKSKKILKKCPVDFKDAIIKPGKRKKNSRIFPAEMNDEILMVIKQHHADSYMDIMFSFIQNNPDDSPFNDHHSRTYFFYDFIDYIENNKKEFLKFK